MVRFTIAGMDIHIIYQLTHNTHHLSSYFTLILSTYIAVILNSKECQVQHWKQHKSECTFIKEKYDDWKKDMSESLPDTTSLDTKEGPCAICLEETISLLPFDHFVPLPY